MTPLSSLSLATVADTWQADVSLQNLTNSWRIECLFPKVQPRQKLFTNDTVFLAVNTSSVIDIAVKIYGDNISRPLEDSLEINIDAESADGNLDALEALYEERRLRIDSD